VLGTFMERVGQILEVFKLLIIFVGLLGLVHGGEGAIGSSLSARLSTLIAPRIMPPLSYGPHGNRS
jgi:cation transporter-like permease